ncbi:MAG: hypothetical protein EZS28_007761, partial [Streblomastix strix]
KKKMMKKKTLDT